MTDSVDGAVEAQEVAPEVEPVEATEAVETPAGADSETEKPDDLAAWKAHSRKHEDRAKALASELENVKSQLAEASKATGRVSELESAVSSAEKRVERAEIAADVAATKGVKLRYLVGETREELEASADEWLTDAQSISRVGVVPTQGTGDPAPRVNDVQLAKERAAAYKL